MTLAILIAIIGPPLAAVVWYLLGWPFPALRRGIFTPPLEFLADWAGCAFTIALINGWDGDWLAMGIAAGNSVLAFLIGWWLLGPRKKRRSAAALLGAKSRALREALVRRAREVARPRPVLRPVPGRVR